LLHVPHRQDDFSLHIHARFAPRILAAVAAAREAERAAATHR
jgi:hypothetical protein